MVSTCASNFSVAIEAGRVDADTITFRCASPNRTRTITFVGTVTGDELSLTWTKQVENGVPGTSLNEAVFGDAAQPRLRARRVRNADLSAAERQLVIDSNQVPGLEFTAGVNLRDQDVKVDGKLFLSQKTARVRAVIVAIRWGLGGDFYWDSQLRTMAQATDSAILQAWITSVRTDGNSITVNNNAGRGGAEGLLVLLERLAGESAHPELARAPLLFWGHSTAGP